MKICMYCQEERTADLFGSVEHVLPQSFGRFRDNMTLHGVVCASCNQYFGDNLEIYLGRDSLEGQMRFTYGVKAADEFRSIGRAPRITVKCSEGVFAGCYMVRYYSEETGSVAVRPLPQVGFLVGPSQSYTYFLLDEIPAVDDLRAVGFQEGHPRSILGLEIDRDDLSRRLAERGFSFRFEAPYVPSGSADSIGCDVEGVIDHVIFRSIAKIAFNYVAYWEGSDFVQQQAFDLTRRYIRWQQLPGVQLIAVDEEPILADEPLEGERRLGHLVTVNWASDGTSVLAQVSLFNWMKYRICLAPNVGGPPPKLTRGHFFDTSNQEILELGSNLKFKA